AESLARAAAEAAATTAAAKSATAGTARAAARATRTTATWRAGLHDRLAGQQTLALGLLPRQLARETHGLGLRADTLLGGLLVIIPELHLTENALALHLLLQRLEGLIDVVVSNLNQQAVLSSGCICVPYLSGFRRANHNCARSPRSMRVRQLL